MVEFYNNEIVNKIFETTPDMIAILDKDGKILECNTHHVNNFGYSKEELIGIVGPTDLVAEHDQEKAMNAFMQVVSDGIKLNVPLLCRRKNGSTFPSVWSGSVLREENGLVSGYLVTGKDLSETHELQSKLTRTEEYVKQEKLALLGELSARLVHDVRNPLTVIKNAVSLMRLKHPHLTQDENDLFEKIDDSTERIVLQINDVLNFIKQPILKKDLTSLNTILKSMIPEMKIPQNVTVVLPAKDYQLSCDAEKIRIVFENMIINAIQAMNSSGSIDITSYHDPEYVVIEIHDTGPGIPQEYEKKIFDPLFTTKQTGTGLGLVSCKNIIEAHGGNVEIKRSGNTGATFLIKLPKI